MTLEERDKKHLWHPLKQHQLNPDSLAIVKAKGNYIIQVDGDCIMHSNFVQDHIANASKNTYLFGSRVNIQESYLKTLFASKKIKFNVFSKGIKKRFCQRACFCAWIE